MANDRSIIGGTALDAALRTLPVKIERNILRAALRQGANVYRAEVRATIPVESGALRKSVRVSTRAKGGTVYASLKIGNDKTFYARFLEFGTQRHGVKKGSSVRRGKHQDGVLNPGIEPRPFARPAFDSRAGQAIAAIQAQIRKRLTEAGINTPAPEIIE